MSVLSSQNNFRFEKTFQSKHAVFPANARLHEAAERRQRLMRRAGWHPERSTRSERLDVERGEQIKAFSLPSFVPDEALSLHSFVDWLTSAASQVTTMLVPA